MVLYQKIRAWITSDKYLEPGRKVDKWLEMKYFKLIRRLEEKYPEGTIGGVSTDDFNICKIFVEYKRRFGIGYDHYDLAEHFEAFWRKCMERDPRLQSVWTIQAPEWNFYNKYMSVEDYYKEINERNIIIWNNRKEPITEEYIKEYFSNYVRNEFASYTFKKFSKRFPNVLAESRSRRYKEYFRACDNPHFMTMKCLGNLTYEETFAYFKDAFQPSEKFDVSLDLNHENFEDYNGFPEDRTSYLSSHNWYVYIHIEFDVNNMRRG